MLKTGKIISAILFCLTVFSGRLQSQENKVMHPAPVVNFEMTGFCFGDTTYFTNTSQLGTYYTWVIYQPDTTAWDTIYKSSDFNIKFRFPHKGVYQVELDGDNGHYVTMLRTITIDSVPRANFDYQYCQSQFVNLSCCYTSCWWDLGDGATSTQASPVHFYDSIGHYRVRLAVKKGAYTDTLTDSIHVTSVNTMTGTYTYKVLKDSVFFSANDTIYGPFPSYHWAFGDGNVFDATAIGGGKKVWHTYARKDTSYTVFLLVKTSCISAFSQRTIFIPDSTPVVGTTIYPNPVSAGILHIVTDRKAELSSISITDYLGRLMSDWNLIERHKGYDLDLTALPQAVYVIRFMFGGDVIVRKIIRE